MRIIITIKDKKNLGSTVDKILDISSLLQKKFKGFKIGKCKCMSDGTTIKANANTKRCMKKNQIDKINSMIDKMVEEDINHEMK